MNSAGHRTRAQLALLVFVAALALASAAAAKEGTAVVVIGPNRQALVEPFAPFATTLQQFGPSPGASAPDAPYLLVYPLMEQGIPMRPGRWYPAQQVLCSGWRTGVDAGCVHAPRLRSWLGSGIATGLFHQTPTLLTRLTRRQTALRANGNEATAIEMSLNQYGHPGTKPPGCAPFTARWSGPRRNAKPLSFCVAATGGVYAVGKVYPLTAGAARFVIGG